MGALCTLDVFVRRTLAALTLLCVAGSVSSSLWNHPHSLAYFNEAAGGPENGWRHMLRSNIDWGQDLLYLKRWQDQHARGEHLFLAYYGIGDPRPLGLTCQAVELSSAGPEGHSELHPGWYAISVSLLAGMPWFSIPSDGGQVLRYQNHEFRRFNTMTPVRRIGGSLLLLHVAPTARPP